MKRLVPLPSEIAQKLALQKEMGLGYQFVSVKLKDGRHFDPAVASNEQKLLPRHPL